MAIISLTAIQRDISHRPVGVCLSPLVANGCGADACGVAYRNDLT